jgi:CubicO group peptidase (beta-lactamase class C family)
MKTVSFFSFCSLILLCSCLTDESIKKDYSGFTPKEIHDDWEISTPEHEGMDTILLKKTFQLLFEENRYTLARSLLVFRNGKLVAEAYPNNEKDMMDIANIQSCTKSITSILVGAALQKGIITDLDQKLYDFFPNDFDSNLDKRKITLKHALKMEAGLEFDNSKNTLQLYQTDRNSIRWILAFNQKHSPGTFMNYNDGAPHLVSKAIQVKALKPLSEFSKEVLFDPLGIKDWKWENSKDGTTFGAFSLFLKPRDLGKIGQLLLQNGVWKGNQIIAQDYLSYATSMQTTANLDGRPYGYYFWILPEYNAFYALGHGGQFILVAPNQDLVVVYTAWPYTSGKFWDNPMDLIKPIIESCN